MTRSAVPLLRSTHPLGEGLPALYAANDFAQRFTEGLDTVLAPILSTLDNLTAYFDPSLAPEDFLSWLADWVAVDLDSEWPLALRRGVVALAVELHRWKGTRRGLVDRLWVYLGLAARVVDGAPAVWSTRHGTPLPGSPVGEAIVQVWPRTPGRPVDAARVAEVVASACPVHLTCSVEVLQGRPRTEGGT